MFGLARLIAGLGHDLPAADVEKSTVSSDRGDLLIPLALLPLGIPSELFPVAVSILSHGCPAVTGY